MDDEVGTLKQQVGDPDALEVTTSTGTQTLSVALDDRVNKGEVGGEEIETETGTQTVEQAIDNRLIALTPGDVSGTAATADIGSAIGEVVVYEDDGDGNPVITGEVAFDPDGTTLESTKQGPAIKELFDLVTSGDIQWLGTPIGQPFPLSLHIAGVERPPQNIPGAVFIELTAGLDGVGDYNEGLLINEDVDATAIDGNGHVDLRITAEINLPGSPSHGEIVNLINSEGRAIIAGETSGVLWADQMQRLEGTFRTWARSSNVAADGVFENVGLVGGSAPGTGNGSAARYRFNSALSSDARTSATTGGPTLIKSTTGVMFFRLPNVVGV
jgi:hypothetical protein